MTAATLQLGTPGGRVAAELVGYNLELGQEVSTALLADRLRNPRFVGPAHPTTGMAPEWFPFLRPTARFAWKAELTPGVALSGESSQFLAKYGPGTDIGMVQTGVPVRAGETLQVEVWALAQNEPCTLRVGLRPAPIDFEDHVSADLDVVWPCWTRYTVELRVDVDDPDAEFYLRLLGEGALWIDQVHLRPDGEVYRHDVVDALRRLRPSVLRFPGGCASTVYRWRDGVGPVQRRPTVHDPVWMDLLVHDFGTDEFLQLCLDTGATPHLTLTVGNGTRDDARDWLEHCRNWYVDQGLAPAPMFVQVGNEQWGHWELGRTTPAVYAALLAEWSATVREVYPEAVVIALGPDRTQDVEDATGTAVGRPWRRVVVAAGGGACDLLAVQLYGHTGGTAHDPDAYAERVLAEAATVLGIVTAAVRDAQAAGRSAAVTEWNLWTHGTSHGVYTEPDDVAHVVFLATVMNGFVRLYPGLALAELETAVNWFGALMVEPLTVTWTMHAEVLGWYRAALPGRLRSVQVEHPAIDAVALHDESGALTVVLVNRSAEQAVEVLTLGQVQWCTLSADHPLAAATLTSGSVGSGASLCLPPFSVTRMVLHV